MSTTVSFHARAERELTDTAQVYESQSPGLGAAVLDDAEKCASDVATHPRAGRVILGMVRRRLLRRFPYALIYKISPDGLRILAVMNLRRRPHYWTERE